MSNDVLRIKGVKTKTGLGRSQIYQLLKEQKFTSQIKLGRRAVGWLEHEIDEWINSRKAERDAR